MKDRVGSRTKSLLIAVVLALVWSLPAYGGSGAGDFDFYVLALTWSPDFCAGKGGKKTAQCAPGRNPGFVLHGLWPQYQKGFPQYCSTQPFPPRLKEEFPGLFPIEHLYAHEWRRHGTCSRLSPREYLALAEKLKNALSLPREYRRLNAAMRTTTANFVKQFQSENKNLPDKGMAVFCSGGGRFLKEVFLCYAKDGKPTACSDEIMAKSARSCGRGDFLIRPGR